MRGRHGESGGIAARARAGAFAVVIAVGAASGGLAHTAGQDATVRLASAENRGAVEVAPAHAPPGAPLASAPHARPEILDRPNLEFADEPLMLVVSLADQRVVVYRGDKEIDRSPVSTGRRGYSTPAGIYSILEKKRHHRSNLYDDAPMPYMQRITWSGIALHQGRVPGYPASHGCIRLPRAFARNMFSLTERGASVVISRDAAEPASIAHDALFQPVRPRLLRRDETVAPSAAPMDAAFDLEADVDELEAYQARSDAPIRVLITRATRREKVMSAQRLLKRLGYDPNGIDGAVGRGTIQAIKAFERDKGERETGMFTDELVAALHAATGAPKIEGHLYVRQNHKDLFDAPVAIADPDAPLGTHLFTAQAFDAKDATADWRALTIDGGDQTDAATALDRITIPELLRRRISMLLTPRSTLIVSDAGRGRETGRGTDFIVQP